MKFHGSRNFVSKHVYDMIWEEPKGTTITVKILEDKCEVEVTKQVREENISTAEEG